EAANRSFGIDLALLKEGQEAALSLGRHTVGRNVTYFETGQGSALSADAAFGVDQQTLEARAYAVARRFDPLLVNSVVGFIGPEYLFDGKQILRAGFEDHFCGKLLGLPMGLDICYTNHAEADQDDMDTLLSMATLAGVCFIMGVPGGDDIMLHYQSTSFHDAAYARALMGLRPAPEFERWLIELGIFDGEGRLSPAALTGESRRLPDPAPALLWPARRSAPMSGQGSGRPPTPASALAAAARPCRPGPCSTCNTPMPWRGTRCTRPWRSRRSSTPWRPCRPSWSRAWPAAPISPAPTSDEGWPSATANGLSPVTRTWPLSWATACPPARWRRAGLCWSAR